MSLDCLAIVPSRAQLGLESPLVTVEVHLTGGLPSMSIVGLPETAVRESKDRVRSAVMNSSFDFPQRRITVNLAPADLPKEGGRFDLAIAVGIVAASGQMDGTRLGEHELIGELALDGALRPVPGALLAALRCREAGRSLVVPAACGAEAALVEGAKVHVANHLLEVCAHLNGAERLPGAQRPPPCAADPADGLADLDDVQGQHVAKRALEITAAGAHNLLLIGPPGTGKTMLAQRLPGLLPPLAEDEALEVAAVRSVARAPLEVHRWHERPFRAPHHTASAVALVGGGSHPRPGEITLAHRGVLFLDELPEFERRVLEVLREPLESGRVTVSRAACRADFPARVMLVTAMNPCPCGHLGDSAARCACTAEAVRRYRSRISGPLLDRIDLHVEVPRTSIRRTGARAAPTSPRRGSAEARTRVLAARRMQRERQDCLNAELGPVLLARHCPLGSDAEDLLDAAVLRLGLSLRARTRIVRVARSIADLAGRAAIEPAHLAEAVSYRCLDRA